MLRNKFNQASKTLHTAANFHIEIEEDTNPWKESACSWLGRVNVAQMFLLCAHFNNTYTNVPTTHLTVFKD